MKVYFLYVLYVCISHHKSSYSSFASQYPISSPFLVLLHPYISLLTDHLRCCQSWHLPFICQHAYTLALPISSTQVCRHARVSLINVCCSSVPCTCFHVFMCSFISMHVRFNGKRWSSQQPIQELAQGGSTHYPSNCLGRKKTQREGDGEGMQHLSFRAKQQ